MRATGSARTRLVPMIPVVLACSIACSGRVAMNVSAGAGSGGAASGSGTGPGASSSSTTGGSSTTGSGSGATTSSSSGSTAGQSSSSSGGPGGVTVLASGQQGPFAVAVDGVNVYWTNYLGGTVMKCAVGGCGGSPTALATKQTYAMGLALDATSVYWTMKGIRKCAIAGCADHPTTLVSIDFEGPSALVVDSGSVYFPNGGAINRCAVSGCGGSATALTPWTGWPDAPSIAADGIDVYWVEPLYGTIMKCSEPDCASGQVTLGGASSDSFVAVDATNVYWTTRGMNMPGTVTKADKSGSGASPLATGNFAPNGLATDGTSVYWTDVDGGTVMKCAVAGCGGAPTTIASGQVEPVGIAVDGTSVYWADFTAGTILKAPK